MLVVVCFRQEKRSVFVLRLLELPSGDGGQVTKTHHFNMGNRQKHLKNLSPIIFMGNYCKRFAKNLSLMVNMNLQPICVTWVGFDPLALQKFCPICGRPARTRHTFYSDCVWRRQVGNIPAEGKAFFLCVVGGEISR